jgi:fermentation-respiration switch protein FrsA (DUF1100 family)
MWATFTILSFFLGVAGLAMAFARTPPGEAASNWTQWSKKAGIHKVFGWLRAWSADRRMFLSAMVAMSALFFLSGIALDRWIGTRLVPSEGPVNSPESPAQQRRLSDDRKRLLAKALANLKDITPQLPVTFVNGDRESETYMHDFADAFRRAGIAPVFTWTSPDGPDQVGVFIALKDPKSQAQSPEVQGLRSALKEIGVDAPIISLPKTGIDGAPPASIALYVAPRPL